jgi:radical SAM superfamily enzyme YgiQ (UPF0313 family)
VPDIILTTLNARYIHAAFGLRYLMANLGDLQPRARILEFDINQRPINIIEKILLHDPKIVGIGVYIWNAAESLQLVADLKRIRPDVIVVLGGPEVSHETDQQEICQLADYTITGEADLAFADLCRKLLAGTRPATRIVPAQLPQFVLNPEPRTLNPPPLTLPYHLYTDEDIRNRIIYVEASRGCPFRCEFCLSSLDVPVRNAPLNEFLNAMQSLLDRGVRHFKFVDRTFNLNLQISRSIIQFFLDRYRPGLFLHFEMIPDRLPEPLRELMAQFPPAALQFEVGVQTFNEDVAKLISRRQDNEKLADNFRFLRQRTGVHIHADLIAGLPGEDLASFARGFDRLVALDPQEIQLGILKRLRGTPIVRHDREWGMVYSPHPPYEILQTKLIDFPTMQRLRRFSRYWDLIVNSGNFITTAPLLWQNRSPFDSFMQFADWLYATTNQTHAIALRRLAELLFTYLTKQANHAPAPTAAHLWQDYQHTGRSDRPPFLAPHITHLPHHPRPMQKTNPRQSRHLTAAEE